jgi:hypothetical protein
VQPPDTSDWSGTNATVSRAVIVVSARPFLAAFLDTFLALPALGRAYVAAAGFEDVNAAPRQSLI